MIIVRGRGGTMVGGIVVAAAAPVAAAALGCGAYWLWRNLTD
ncbi:MAG: hypothetical protein RM368_29925 [Nostoc sp. DedSLP03]|nr:hypothetical protein [Nostoc sp. DedSLP03]MDZ7969121.1 hypothetical protein [Nostoc sp. DedSLP03]